jgi:A/G-specific adenine glycosylase
MARDDGGRVHVLMKKRPDKGLLAGMWEFPGVEVEAASASAPRYRKAVTQLTRSLGLPGPSSSRALEASLTDLGEVNHAFSHLKVCYRPFLLQTSHPIQRKSRSGAAQWISEEVIHELPTPVAQQKILRAAEEYLAD